MAELQFHITDLSHIPGCVLVKMNGAIDATTVLTFQSTLENLQLNGVTRFILDMEGIKYVNSTGLGSLVRLADQLENEGGGFALVKIHPKVKVVFDMLGLNAFFKIFGSREEAEGYFKKSGGGSAAPAMAAAPPQVQQQRPVQPPPPQRAAVPPPPPPPPPPPMRGVPAAAGQRPGHMAPQQAAARPGAHGGFDARAITCQNCGVTLKIQQPGTFKCSRCFTVFNVGPTGQVEFTRTSRPTPLQMNLTCAEECKEGLLLFLGAIARRVGFDQNRIQGLQHCVAEVVGHICAEAYGNNPQNTYSVLIAPINGEMNIKFADHGRTFDARNPHLFGHTRSMMSSFDVKPHPQGGNIVTMKMTAY